MKRLLHVMRHLEQMTKKYCHQFSLMHHLFKINHMIFPNNECFEQMEKWSSYGLNRICSKQECGCSTIIDYVEGQTITQSFLMESK